MNEQRKQIWINQFQSKLFVRIGVYWLIYQLTVWNFLFIAKLLREGPGDPLGQLAELFEQHLPTLICFVVIVPLLAWDAVKFSHRLVGPLVRFQRTFQAIAAGKQVRAIRLRDGDFLGELKDEINSMLENLHQQNAPDSTTQEESHDSYWSASSK